MTPRSLIPAVFIVCGIALLHLPSAPGDELMQFWFGVFFICFGTAFVYTDIRECQQDKALNRKLTAEAERELARKLKASAMEGRV